MPGRPLQYAVETTPRRNAVGASSRRSASTNPKNPTGLGEPVGVVINIDGITVGERDREDLGDIAELAESINEVGLLHPVVVTADHQLIAGERRLAAVRHLGWSEVPVTIVDLTNVEDVLRAESDENTCRKPLSPYEAHKAQDRRARVLAPLAEERMKAGLKDQTKPSAKLAEGSRAARETRKLAAIGTGYSGTTLEKVGRICDVAERGVIKRGKEEIPAPEPVREVARKALADVKKTDAAVDRCYRKVTEAIDQYVEEGPEVQNAKYVKAFWKAVRALGRVQQFDLSRARGAFSQEDWENVDRLVIDGIKCWIKEFEAIRPGK